MLKKTVASVMAATTKELETILKAQTKTANKAQEKINKAQELKDAADVEAGIAEIAIENFKKLFGLEVEKPLEVEEASEK